MEDKKIFDIATKEIKKEISKIRERLNNIQWILGEGSKEIEHKREVI